MYQYLSVIESLKTFNGTQIKVKGLSVEGKVIYLYTTKSGLWKQTTQEFWEA